MKIIMYLLILGLLISCGAKPSTGEEYSSTSGIMTDVKALLQQTVSAHGGKAYESAHYEFNFRDRRYEFENDGNAYRYSRTTTQGDTVTVDVLDNGKLSRSINGTAIELSAKDQGKYRESVNSVIYFATLPHKLLDPAVNLKVVGGTMIKEVSYDILEVTFNQEGGGDDYDDQFYYWINKADHTIDYLAYSYQTDGGGVRFRSAYNRRVIDGIIFQDYVNYKARIGTPLATLPRLYEKNILKELSKIETEEVKSLK